MKRGLFLVASLVIGSALCSQAEEPLFSREQVLDIFSLYNPSVFEKAKQNDTYAELLDQFVQAFQVPDTLDNRVALIAAARNFETSLRLHDLTELYVEKATWARMSAQDPHGIDTLYRLDVQDEMANIYAVSLQVNRWKLQEFQQALKKARQEDLPQEQKEERINRLKAEIKQQKAAVRSLEENAGELVLQFTDNQVAQAKQQVTQRLTAFGRAAAQEDSAAQAANLQIKTNHKHPVAK
jgi:hypothetical protein